MSSTSNFPIRIKTGPNKIYEYPNTNSVPVTGFTGIPISFFLTQSVIESQNILNTKQTPVWVFGDGTSIEGLTATKIFDNPAVNTFEVRLVSYDNSGNTIVNVNAGQLYLINYLPELLSFSNSNSLSSTSLSAVTGYANYFTGPINLIRSNSWQTVFSMNSAYDITCFCYGSSSKQLSLRSYYENKWAHLFNYWRFYSADTFGIPVSSVSSSFVPVYLLYDGVSSYECDYDSQITTNAEIISAAFVGSRGAAEIYFVDDIPGYKKLYFDFDYSNLPSVVPLKNTTSFNLLPVVNSGPLALSAYTISSPVSGVSITGFGLPGYEIDPFFYENNGNVIFVNLLSEQGTTVTNLSSLTVSVSSNFNAAISAFDDNYYTQQFSLNTAKKKINLPNTYACVLYGLNGASTVSKPTLTFSVTAVSSGQSFVYNTSLPVYVAPVSGFFNIRKIEENFSPIDAYRSYSFQLNLQNMVQLFNDFFQVILGNESSDPNLLGKKTYEKISNFEINISDADKANLKALEGLFTSLNYTAPTFNYAYPGDLARLTDLLSIKLSKLKGSLSHGNNQFYNSNTSSKSINLGDTINYNTYYVSAGTDIVLYQLFGNIFTRLTTMCKVSSELVNYPFSVPPLNHLYTGTNLLSTYPLSCYSENTFGWGITNDYNNINQQYEFYSFVPLLVPDSNLQYDFNPQLVSPYNQFTVNSTLEPSASGFYEDNAFKSAFAEYLINWLDPSNGLLFSQLSALNTWNGTDGLMEKLLDYQLKKGLQLINE